MESHNEEFKYISIAGKDIDVSNIQYQRGLISSKMWEKQRLKEYKDSVKQVNDFNIMVLNVARYLIRQPLMHLMKRYSFKDSITEYVKRFFLTNRKIKTSTKSEYEIIEDWIYEEITGKKKVSLVRQKGILEVMEETLETLENATNLNTKQCLKLLQTFAQDQARELTNSTKDLRA